MHYHDITKAQNLSSKLAHKAGTTRDELRRAKDKSRIVKSILKASKTFDNGEKRSKSVGPRYVPAWSAANPIDFTTKKKTSINDSRQSVFVPKSML